MSDKELNRRKVLGTIAAAGTYAGATGIAAADEHSQQEEESIAFDELSGESRSLVNRALNTDGGIEVPGEEFTEELYRFDRLERNDETYTIEEGIHHESTYRISPEQVSESEVEENAEILTASDMSGEAVNGLQRALANGQESWTTDVPDTFASFARYVRLRNNLYRLNKAHIDELFVTLNPDPISSEAN